MRIRNALLPIYRTEELRKLEASASAAPLMERAGLAAAGVAAAMIGERTGAVLVLAGPGNNGGDAFVAARHLRDAFFDVTVVFPGDVSKLPADARAAHHALIAAGIETVATLPADWRGSLVIDGLFGIGLARPLAAEYSGLVEWANASGAPILALDIPSGLAADSGVALGATIRAAATATFIALKPGLLTGDGVDHCGTISVHPLELDPESIVAANGHRLDWRVLAADIPEPLTRERRNVHKGTFGTLGIIGGAAGMTGAPLLAGRSALHAGAGKVWIGFVAPEHPAVDWGQPELMLRTADEVLGGSPDALICGPGLGSGMPASSVVARVLDADVPLVLDADALNAIAADRSLAARAAARHAPTLVTPHPTEASRLLGTTTEEVQRDRLHAAGSIATMLNAAVVLKGAGSVLAYPDSTWDINASGNPGLASAGTGDVLAGIAGAFLAQGLAAKAALRYAVCVHGAAADACIAEGRGPLGLTAGELATVARRLLNAR